MDEQCGPSLPKDSCHLRGVGDLAPALGEARHLLCGASERVRRKYGEVGTERYGQQGVWWCAAEVGQGGKAGYGGSGRWRHILVWRG